MVPLTTQDLDLAWRRSMIDAGRRGFVTHPYLQQIIELDRKRWLAELEASLQVSINPESPVRCLVPKPGAMLRPGSILTFQDEVVYNALVESALQPIWNGIRWSQGNPDLAYQILPPERKSKYWVRRGSSGWRQYRALSLAALRQDVSHVVTTDITGFYENIDLSRLSSDLRALGVPNDIVGELQKCLHRWSGPREKGIPQGYTASDILAKVYLNSVDQELRRARHSHIRYVDDFRIFCTSFQEARIVIRTLTELMSNRGLNLQTAKTVIKTKTDAYSDFLGVQKVFEDVTARLTKALGRIASASPYLPAPALFRALTRKRGQPPEVLERTFREYFSITAPGKFDRSLFHFLLNRLGAAGSRVAVEYCVELLRDMPEESGDILNYLSSVPLETSEIDKLLAFMGSSEAIYDYQLFQLVRWFHSRSDLAPLVLDLCRGWAFDRNRDPWLRTYCIACIGDYGDLADLGQLEAKYGSASSGIERATYAISLRRLESGRRNSFYGRIKTDGDLVARAIIIAKAWPPRPRIDPKAKTIPHVAKEHVYIRPKELRS